MKYEKRKEEKALRTPRFLISIFHSHYHREALGMVVKDIIENYPLTVIYILAMILLGIVTKWLGWW